MMPSFVDSYNDDNLLATDKTTADDNFDVNHQLYQTFAKYAQLYQQYPTLRFGEQEVVYSQDKPGVFAITRQVKVSDKGSNKAKAQDVLVVFNTANKAQRLDVITQKINDKQANSKLVYRSSKTTKEGEISPLSFAIYQLK